MALVRPVAARTLAASADRVPVILDEYLLSMLLAVTIVVSVKVVGIVLISAFLVIPRSGPLSVPALYVDDSVPADSVDSPLLYRHLSELWGRSAVLALGVNELQSALRDPDPGRRREALKRIRGYLQAERSNAGPGNDALVSQLQGVIEVIDRELRR